MAKRAIELGREGKYEEPVEVKLRDCDVAAVEARKGSPLTEAELDQPIFLNKPNGEKVTAADLLDEWHLEAFVEADLDDEEDPEEDEEDPEDEIGESFDLTLRVEQYDQQVGYDLGSIRVNGGKEAAQTLMLNEWALFQQEEPDTDAQFIDWLVERYPDTFEAIEPRETFVVARF
jgi:hypothetical protein